MNKNKNLKIIVKDRFVIKVCLFLFLLVSFKGTTQKYNILNFSTRDGLQSEIVNDVFQDKDGYIWFATQSGISQYNGQEFTEFAPLKILSGVDAVSVVQDKKGRICIGTNTNGLFIYDYKNTINFKKGKGLSTDVIRKLFLDKTGTLWVLTPSGVYKLINDKLIEFNDPNKIFKSGVLSMTQTENGDYWFGTQGNGLVQYSAKKFSYFNLNDGIQDDYIFSLGAFGDSVLLGTTNQGVLVGFESKFSKLLIKEIENAWISCIIPNKQELNIISSNGLFVLRQNGSYSKITDKNGLTSNDLYNGYFDREKNLWLASGNGVSCLKKEEIISLDKESGLSNEKITCLAHLIDGRIIAGTYGYGLNIINNNGEVTKQILPKELINVKITTICEIPERNELWIGTEQSNFGIIILNTKDNKFNVKRIISKIRNVYLQTVTKIEKDKDKNIWVGSFNAGLFKLSAKDTIQYSSRNLLPSNEVYTFLIDVHGNPWVSIYQKGLYRFTGKSFVAVYDAKKLNDKFILSLEEDNKGAIYIGTKSHGLIIYNNEKFDQLSKKEGLISNSIQAIKWHLGELWVGTERGINLLKRRGEGKYYIITYDERSGLVNMEIQQNAILFSNNALWTGSGTGLSCIKRSDKSQRYLKPYIELKSIQLFYNDVDWKVKSKNNVNKRGIPKSLELKYTENHLTFKFCALTTSSVFYSYYLEGEESNWVPLSDKTEVTYSKLNSGNYVFHVKSVDNFGVESEVLSIPIVINSPIWERLWFRIAVILLVIILIGLFIRLRERNYRERQRVLETMVQERTKEVVDASNKIDQQIKLVELKNKEILDSITYAKRIQTAMLPSKQLLQTEFNEIFVYYQPKDIVAGDFYWFDKIGNKKLIAVADCTGHGVPGAMVSVVCNNALNRSIREYGMYEPAKLLNKTRELILSEFSKNLDDMKDGMDISLALFDPESYILEWAGANNPIWILKKNSQEITEIKGDKQPIGVHINNNKYTNHSVQLEKGDLIYLLTDGFADQFGGPLGKKLKSAQLKQYIVSLNKISFNEQEKHLHNFFETWKGDQEQVDDVCLIGIEV